MRLPLALALAALVLSPGASAAQDPVQDVLDGLRATHGLPGASVAWTGADGRVQRRVTGWADPDAGVPMSPRSRMLAASIGKSFVAAAALSLQAEGLLDLDDPLSTWLGGRRWFPRLPNHGSLTLRHLLTHSGGLPDHVHLPAFAERVGRVDPDGPAPGPEELIALILDRPPLFPAGEGWSYSDTGYLLVGLVIEEVSGRPWAEVVERRFLRPLALEETEPSDVPRLEGLAVGVTAPDNPFGLPARTVDPQGRLVWHPGIEGAGGGFVTTPGDLARWGRLLWSGRAMERAYLGEMLTGVPLGPDAPGASYGLGVRIDTGGPLGEVRGHRGWIPGYVSSLRYLPARDLAIAIQINTDVGMVGPDGALARVEAEVARALLGLSGGRRP